MYRNLSDLDLNVYYSLLILTNHDEISEYVMLYGELII